MRRKITALFSLVFAFWLLSGCAAKTPTSALNQVALTTNVALLLSSPPPLLWGKTQVQLMTITYDNEQHTLLTQTEFQSNSITMAAMTPAGIPIVTVHYQHNAPLEVKQYIPLQRFDAKYIIADIQLALWPIDVLKKHLVSRDATLTESNGQRLLFSKDAPLITITTQTDTTTLLHHERGYQIQLTQVH